MKLIACLLIAMTALSWVASADAQQPKPNIVLVFMDNFGWGEPGFNGGGIIRGCPTPRLDQLAAEGMRSDPRSRHRCRTSLRQGHRIAILETRDR